MEDEPSCSRFKTNQLISEELLSEEKDVCDERTQAENVPEGDTNKNREDDFGVPDLPEDHKETYQSYIDEVKALASVPILQSVTSEHITNFKHYNLRYYEDKYCVNFPLPETGYCDLLIRMHSNKLFLISLASGNDIIRCGKEITGINFMINNRDRSNITLGGKRKKGAKGIQRGTILCQVKCEGIPEMFNVRAGIVGKVLEINELIKKNPNLLRTDPKGLGFLAVVIGKHSQSSYDTLTDKLLSEDEYLKYLTERTPKFSEQS